MKKRYLMVYLSPEKQDNYEEKGQQDLTRR
jgi:hypothetical protein